jgi:predicted patatin/cPLA2 family phospholipase
MGSTPITSTMNENQFKILNLELEKKQHVLDYLNKKLKRYQKANSRISNAISKEEIEDLIFQIKSTEIEIEILQTKIKDFNDAS